MVMKKSKLWVPIPIYWIAFSIYNVFLDQISLYFPYDFIVGSDKYHYGACSFSITISFVLLILEIVYIVTKAIKEKFLKNSKKNVAIVVGILVFSFIVQFFYYLNHFSYYYLFGIVLW